MAFKEKKIETLKEYFELNTSFKEIILQCLLARKYFIDIYKYRITNK